MDFYTIEAIRNGHGRIEISPSLRVIKSKDLMIKGGKFYAFWDDANSIWCTDMYRLYECIDNDIQKFLEDKPEFKHEKVNYMRTYKSQAAKEFEQYVRLLPDNWHSLDDTVTFLSEKIGREDYKSRRLPYDPKKGDISAYEELVNVLYFPEEREKIEWAIGSILCGESKDIQKFMVLYGNAGTGKSTIMNMIDDMFPGYVTTFDSKALGSGNSSFSLEPFENNPLVGIQHDGDLSRIEDNTKINSVVSHEMININAKYKNIYAMRLNCFLFIGTNKPVKITDAKSGIIRRLIDVHPTGETVEQSRYEELCDIIAFETSAIAYHCMQVYKSLGRRYYSGYRPLDMMYKTDPFFNFVDAYYLTFKNQDSTTLKQAYALYKEWVDNGGSDFKMTSYKFREALKDYFLEYINRTTDAVGVEVCDLYKGFKVDLFKDRVRIIERNAVDKIILTVHTLSVLDDILADCFAQYATRDGKPQCAWDNVRTKLRNIDPTRQHYVKPPENLIVIDFDLKDENGNKSTKLNLEAAAKFPPTYTELSRSGGVHLHYYYDGDINLLGDIYAEHIEIKKFKGGSSLRRKLTKCNDIPIAHIRDGLPLKGEKMVDFKGINDEKHLRNIIAKNLAKQISPNTKPSIDFIYNALEQAYESGMHYDVSDMRQAIVLLAMSSTNQSDACLKLVAKMKFCSEEPSEDINWDDVKNLDSKINVEEDLVFYDVEVFPNLFLVNWKKIGEGKRMHRMINPTPQEIEQLISMPLVGYNCRRYDNHICYARMMGYTNEQLYNLSQKIINAGKKGPKDCFFKEAYNISYTDIYDYATKKQSLKKWEIELGIHHEELGLPWDQPVPEELWDKVAHYCDNDVYATEAVWNATQGDWAARKILAKIAGMTPNSTTNSLTTRIIFGKDSYEQVQSELKYTDLSEMFPGYKFEKGKSFYKGYEVGEGGFVYAEPGVHGRCKVFDVVSMHPHSLIALNMFGKYTSRFKEILDARVAAKHDDLEALNALLDGLLLEYMDRGEEIKAALVLALKIAINSVYGLTCAQFDHIFRDKRNVDNIVAKRGALFMIDLKEEVEKLGYRVVHIKTDSIKVENPDEFIENFINEYGKKYGYEFEVEDEFQRICLINNAEFIAYDDRKNEWRPKGDRFKTPYILKTIFTKEDLEFKDLCLTASVTSEIDLDFNENLPDSAALDKELDDILKVRKYLAGMTLAAPSKKKIELYGNVTDKDIDNLKAEIAKCHSYQFVGRVGLFVPILPGCGGGVLVRKNGDKFDNVQDTSGYRWLEAEKVQGTEMEQNIDYSFWNNKVSDILDIMRRTLEENNTTPFFHSIEEFLDVGALPF